MISHSHPNVVDLAQLLTFASDHIPEGWEIRLYINRDETAIVLFDDYESSTGVCTDGMDTVEAFVEHVNHARRLMGMDEVRFGPAEEQH